MTITPILNINKPYVLKRHLNVYRKPLKVKMGQILGDFIRISVVFADRNEIICLKVNTCLCGCERLDMMKMRAGFS